MNVAMALLAFAIFTGSLLILIMKVPSIDLVIVVVTTIVFVAYDVITSLRDKSY
jgi:succinate-acetate transporter protein